MNGLGLIFQSIKTFVTKVLNSDKVFVRSVQTHSSIK